MIDISQYRKGSFEGIEFETLTAGLRFEHRLDVKRYPYQDKGLVTDLGLSEDRFELAIFVIGSDFLTRRAALEKAFRKTGPGLLVHPTRGEIRVNVERVRLDEDLQELGVADFQVTFVKSDATLAPRAVVDTKAAVISSSAATTAATPAAVTLSNLTDPLVMKAAESHMATFTDALNTASGVLNELSPDKIISGFDAVQQLKADLGTAYTNTQASLALVGQVQSVVTSWAGLFGVPKKALDFALGLLNLGSVMNLVDNGYVVSGQSIVRTPTVTSFKTQNTVGDNAANRQSIADTFDLTIAQVAAALATDTELDTLTKAVSTRDTITRKLDEIATAERPGTLPAEIAEFRSSVRSLKTATYRDITERAGQLPALESYTPASRQPARVLAYRLAAGIDTETAIVQRNDIQHPSFVPTNRPLFYLASTKNGGPGNA
ncbi:MAG: hypothetical protein CMM61_08145 [Rhodospirillaceae bacterium]|nr:hypothetical protein [Rhodospirillaceae bacterium]